MKPLQLQKTIAAVMRGVGPPLGELHWKGSTGWGKESKVLPEEAMGMVEAARAARGLMDPGWRGEKGQARWQARRVLEWAARELSLSRREIEVEQGDIQDWLQREKMERKMGDSLLKRLGFEAQGVEEAAG